MGQRSLGAQLAFALADRGVSHIFGVPGVHNLELYRGIDEAGLTHILARHEQGAGFMADGYARVSGQAGVAFVISGPGLCNIMTPMGQAYSDSVPMLVVSSALPISADRQTKLHQMKDQRMAAECVCDWSEEAHDADTAFDLVARAFDEFQTQRARPKHIQVPLDLLAQLVSDPKAVAPAERPKFNPDLRVLVEALNMAKRPMFIVGAGAKGADVSSLQNRLNAAVFETYAGKAVVPFDASLNYGSYLARPGSATEIAKADLVLVLGSELSEVDLWRDALGAECPVFVVDIAPQTHPLLDQAQMIEGDCARVVAELFERLEARSSEWTAREVSEARAGFRMEVDQERHGIVDIAEGLAAGLPDDVWLVSDMTQFAYSAKEVFHQKRAGHWLHPYGFGTLGYALPAAIGAKIARPKDKVLAIAGDYGFQYTLQELGTAAELGQALPIMIWDNSELKEITASMAAVQMPPTETTAQNPDFEALAAAYRLDYAAPFSLADLLLAILAAFERDRPTLIRVTPEITI
ncbi:MAG: thiamine pyrophosphate-binding protein [Pseudomonadota bacterium]